MKIIIFLIISFSFSSLGVGAVQGPAGLDRRLDSTSKANPLDITSHQKSNVTTTTNNNNVETGVKAVSAGWGDVGLLAVSMATSMMDSEDAQKVGVGIDTAIGWKKIKAGCMTVPVGGAVCALGWLHIASAAMGIHNYLDTRKKRKEHYGGSGGSSGSNGGDGGGGSSGGSSGGDGNGNDDPRCTSEDGADDTRCQLQIAQNSCKENPQDVGCDVFEALGNLCNQPGINCDDLPNKFTGPNGETIDLTKTKPSKITDDEYKEALASVKASHPELFSSSGSSGGSSAEGSDVGSDDFILEEGDFEEGVSASDYYGSNGGKSGGPITIRRGLSSTDDEDDEDVNNWYAKFQQRLKNNKIDRGSLKFKPKKLGNDQIGTSHDNIFDMMSQGYK